MEDLIKLNSSTPFLSISLLTSNRRDTIRKCLDSLTHLRRTIPSELIIIDTGCDTEMRSIIEEYTDKIYSYVWTDDFAVARNEQIKASKGKWFLYIDDDEWFEDTTEIEDFFNSERYKKVDACWYIQRNYQDFEGKAYSDDLVSRMFALSNGIHFEGCIHEYFTPFSGKFDITHSFVHHYGYIFRNDKDRYQHSLRNLSLCKKMLEIEPTQMRWWIQTAQEYYVIKEYDMLYSHCEAGLLQFQKDNDYFTSRDIAGLYAAMLRTDFNRFNHKLLLSDSEKALMDQRLYPMARAAIHEIRMESFAREGDIDSAAAQALEYFKYYDLVGGNEIAISEQTTYMVDETFSRRYFEVCCWIIIMYAIKHSDLSLLKEYFDKVIWDTPQLFIYKPGTIEDLVYFIADAPYDDWFISAAERILSRSDHVPLIEDILRDFAKKAASDPAAYSSFERLLTIFSQAGVVTPYLAYLKILALDRVENKDSFLYKLYNGNIPSAASINESIADFWRYICSGSDSFLSFDKSFWDILIAHQVDIGEGLLRTDYNTWKACVEKICLASGNF